MWWLWQPDPRWLTSPFKSGTWQLDKHTVCAGSPDPSRVETWRRAYGVTVPGGIVFSPPSLVLFLSGKHKNPPASNFFKKNQSLLASSILYRGKFHISFLSTVSVKSPGPMTEGRTACTEFKGSSRRKYSLLLMARTTSAQLLLWGLQKFPNNCSPMLSSRDVAFSCLDLNPQYVGKKN